MCMVSLRKNTNLQINYHKDKDKYFEEFRVGDANLIKINAKVEEKQNKGDDKLQSKVTVRTQLLRTLWE